MLFFKYFILNYKHRALPLTSYLLPLYRPEICLLFCLTSDYFLLTTYSFLTSQLLPLTSVSSWNLFTFLSYFRLLSTDYLLISHSLPLTSYLLSKVSSCQLNPTPPHYRNKNKYHPPSKIFFILICHDTDSKSSKQ